MNIYINDTFRLGYHLWDLCRTMINSMKQLNFDFDMTVIEIFPFYI